MLSCRNVLLLLESLYNSYKTATDFDERPGLKFLVQKVSRADVAANLYKQAGISMTFYIHTLMEICARQENVCVNNTHMMLAAGQEVCQSDPDSGSKVKDPEYLEAVSSTDSMQKFIGIFVRKLQNIFNEVCTLYVDMYLDAEGPNKSDEISEQILVFLLAEPEELPQLKRDKSIQEMVAEKLKMLNQQTSQESVTSPVTTQAVPIQGKRILPTPVTT